DVRANGCVACRSADVLHGTNRLLRNQSHAVVDDLVGGVQGRPAIWGDVGVNVAKERFGSRGSRTVHLVADGWVAFAIHRRGEGKGDNTRAGGIGVALKSLHQGLTEDVDDGADVVVVGSAG